MNVKRLGQESPKEERMRTYHHKIAAYIYIQQLKNKIDYVEKR